MTQEKQFCTFELDENGQDVHVNIHGMTLEGVSSVVGTSLCDYLSQVAKGKTLREWKEHALDICTDFCEGMQVDPHDLNPWHPSSEVPRTTPFSPPILIAGDMIEDVCIGRYDTETKSYKDSKGNNINTSWWKYIPDIPMSSDFYDQTI